MRVEDYAETLRDHRVLHLVGKGNKPATMPPTVPVLRVLEVCRGERNAGPLILRPEPGMPASRCGTPRSWPATPTRGPPSTTTAPEGTSIAAASTSSPPTSLAHGHWADEQFRITINGWRSTARPRKHGVSYHDIRTVARNYLIAYTLDDDHPARELHLGFDDSGRLLEVVVLLLEEGAELAIHAMKCRPQYFDLLP